MCASFLLAASKAFAAPDPRLSASQIEDRLVDGEIDAEDLLRWRLAPGTIVDAGRGAAYVGLEAFAVERTTGPAEVGAMFVLELPLERFVGRAASIAPIAAVQMFAASGPFALLDANGPASATDGTWLGAVARETAPAPPGDVERRSEPPKSPAIAQSAAPLRSERGAALPALTVTAEVARSCVRAALRTVGLADDHRLDSVASRARSSAALPELRFRAVRTLGESGRISLSEDDPSRYVASGAASNVLEARLTFRLDRLLFADEEIAVERARLDRTELRSRIAAKVLQALFDWQKSYTASQDATLPAEDRWTAALREAESSAILDMMTGGWFGTYRAALAARGS
jgi:hypothetical protein